jgi:membrane-associated phospholipid phosphatase
VPNKDRGFVAPTKESILKPKLTTIRTKHWGIALLSGALLVPQTGFAENLIDHKLPLHTGGIYRAQTAVPVTLAAVSLAGALWEGSETRLGETFWKSGEGMLFSGALAEGIKWVTRRERPSDTNNPNHWFKNTSADSFPSGHVTVTAASVTPIIMEYKNDHPWVMALAALPAYEMVARVYSQRHWQTDVLAGAALGTAVGVIEQRADKPFVVRLLPGGVFIGFRKALP